MKKALALLMLLVIFAFGLPTPQDIAKEVDSGHYRKAQGMLQEVISKDPKSAKAHYMLSQVYYLEGDVENAKYELKLAKKLDPSLSFANNKQYLISYEKKLSRVSDVKTKTKGGAMIFFAVGGLLIIGAVFLLLSNRLNKKNADDIKTKLMQELTTYLENIEKVKTKLSIDLVSLKDDDPAKKDLTTRLSELEELRTNMTDLLSKLKNNQVQDIQGAYVYFENLKDKLKEIATGVKNTYENHDDLRNLATNPQNPNMPNMFGGISFFDMLGMMAMGGLMGSVFSGDFGGPAVNNYDINNYNVDDNQSNSSQDIDFSDGGWDNQDTDFDTGGDDSWN